MSPLGGPSRRLSELPARGTALLVARRPLAGRCRRPAPGASRPGHPPRLGRQRRAATPDLPEAPAFDLPPAFSPDGRAIAYAACDGPRGRRRAATCRCSRSTPRSCPRGRLATCHRRRACLNCGLSLGARRPSHRLQRGRPASGASARTAAPLPSGWSWPAPSRSPLPRARRAIASLSCAYRRLRRLPLRARRRASPARASTLLERQPATRRRTPHRLRVLAIREGSRHLARRRRRIESHASDARLRSPCRAPRRWSPDGRSIAFDLEPGRRQRDIWTIGVDGSGLRLVTCARQRHRAELVA